MLSIEGNWILQVDYFLRPQNEAKKTVFGIFRHVFGTLSGHSRGRTAHRLPIAIPRQAASPHPNTSQNPGEGWKTGPGYPGLLAARNLKEYRK
jgi:hypothetical protein